jgi:hypothetical protein
LEGVITHIEPNVPELPGVVRLTVEPKN